MESPEFQIRFMETGEEAQVCKLVERVFMQDDAQDFPQQGISEFLAYANPVRMAERVTQDLSFVLVAAVEDDLVGMIEIRNYNHIALLFVSDDHQRQGMASHLIEKAITICREKNTALRRITVNASPSALPIYAHWGFHPIGDQIEVDGIPFTQMALDFS
ncbi:predicted acyltransferase [Longilinea arvoryzae]|uniref:Predicted acyltransferase n=1 Tax=Longilinea arvoryzae TaxID=360412 RepID=A0A0S7BIM9_9CHLR|nr:GNAT family N-acetyltransferase [Longilinea arvoryzae]GAP13755.1 predicted acyltransferase [Longilinea arvoryzae]